MRRLVLQIKEGELLDKLRKCDLYENCLCSCEEGFCKDRITGCECLFEFTNEHGYLIDYNSLWSANLCNSPTTSKVGWRVFSEDGEFQGVLDEEKLAIWYVKTGTLVQIAG